MQLPGAHLSVGLGGCVEQGGSAARTPLGAQLERHQVPENSS